MSDYPTVSQTQFLGLSINVPFSVKMFLELIINLR